MRATLIDLKREYWLRKRNNGTLVWKTKAGVDIPIKDMSNEHLFNAISLLEDMQEHEQFMRELEENASDDVLYAGWD